MLVAGMRLWVLRWFVISGWVLASCLAVYDAPPALFCLRAGGGSCAITRTAAIAIPA